MAYLAKTIPHTIFPIMGMPETHSSRSSPTVPVRGKCDGGNKNAATGKSANIIKWWRGEPNDEEATKQIHHLQKPKKSFLKTKANPSPIILTKIGTGNACCKREVSTPVTEIGGKMRSCNKWRVKPNIETHTHITHILIHGVPREGESGEYMLQPRMRSRTNNGTYICWRVNWKTIIYSVFSMYFIY